MCIHMEWYQNQKSQRITLVSKARYLNSKKKKLLENMTGHFVRDLCSRNGQTDKKEPDGPEFVSSIKDSFMVLLKLVCPPADKIAIV